MGVFAGRGRSEDRACCPCSPRWGGIPQRVINKEQRKPGIWCLQFFSDKWHVSRAKESKERAGWLIISTAAHSGRITLLYADELITVSSIGLLYKKVPAPHTVSTATRGPTTLQRKYITISRQAFSLTSALPLEFNYRPPHGAQ
jgi:hypothetical protein